MRLGNREVEPLDDIYRQSYDVDIQNREIFRQQAISYGVADDCIIDKDTYAEISCVAGCFQSGDTWIVYNTDERAQVFGEKKHATSKLAFEDLAKRLGFMLIFRNKVNSVYQSKRPYTYGTGRRKSSVARVHLFSNGEGRITINGRDINDYFGTESLKVIVRQPLTLLGMESMYDVECTVSGGGVSGQAGAVRHGIARALLEKDEMYRPALKAAGYLTRDPRMKERKKYGLKAARRAAQFSKR